MIQKTEIGKRIKIICEIRDIPLQSLAKKAGMTPSNLSALLIQDDFKWSTLMRIITALDMTEEDFFLFRVSK